VGFKDHESAGRGTVVPLQAEHASSIGSRSATTMRRPFATSSLIIFVVLIKSQRPANAGVPQVFRPMVRVQAPRVARG